MQDYLSSEHEEQLELDVLSEQWETPVRHHRAGSFGRAKATEQLRDIESARLLERITRTGQAERYLAKLQAHGDPLVKSLGLGLGPEIPDEQVEPAAVEEQLDEIRAALAKSRELGERAQRGIDALIERRSSAVSGSKT